MDHDPDPHHHRKTDHQGRDGHPVAPRRAADLIREAKVAQMYSAIQTGQQFGMQTLDQNLQALVQKKVISMEEARSKAANKDNFR